jgi:hypothetical protein
MGKKRKLLPAMRSKFLHRIADISFSVSDEEALGLPPIQDIQIPVTLRGEQMEAYYQMEQDFVVELPGLELTAPLVVTQMMRLQQIVGGFLPDESGEPYKLQSIKLKACGEFLESHTGPLVIYCRFLWEIDAIAKLAAKLRRKPSIITGEHRVGSHTKFDVLICQVGIVAGLDGLQHVTSTGLFYSKSFSKIQYDQARSRLRRKGQDKHVKFFHLVAKSTIDFDIDTALQMKGDVIENVVNFLMQRRTLDGQIVEDQGRGRKRRH